MDILKKLQSEVDSTSDEHQREMEEKEKALEKVTIDLMIPAGAQYFVYISPSPFPIRNIWLTKGCKMR